MDVVISMRPLCGLGVITSEGTQQEWVESVSLKDRTVDDGCWTNWTFKFLEVYRSLCLCQDNSISHKERETDLKDLNVMICFWEKNMTSCSTLTNVNNIK